MQGATGIAKLIYNCKIQTHIYLSLANAKAI